MISSQKQEFKKNKKIIIKIKVRTGALKTIFKDKMSDGTFKMDVKAVPEKGKANQEIVKYLKKEFAVKKENVKIISGGRDKFKIVKIVK